MVLALPEESSRVVVLVEEDALEVAGGLGRISRGKPQAVLGLRCAEGAAGVLQCLLPFALGELLLAQHAEEGLPVLVVRAVQLAHRLDRMKAAQGAGAVVLGVVASAPAVALLRVAAHDLHCLVAQPHKLRRGVRLQWEVLLRVGPRALAVHHEGLRQQEGRLHQVGLVHKAERQPPARLRGHRLLDVKIRQRGHPRLQLIRRLGQDGPLSLHRVPCHPLVGRLHFRRALHQRHLHTGVPQPRDGALGVHEHDLQRLPTLVHDGGRLIARAADGADIVDLLQALVEVVGVVHEVVLPRALAQVARPVG
mmetsp:Transcript_12003/g.43833  ORF Transcript_12003/g.43833 Transcript_12003/m.43833 type:complete len:308 (+) Transcript_12003:1085-2008(+)